MMINICEEENSGLMHQLLKRTGKIELFPILSSPKLECIYCANHEAELVGMVMAWKSKFHPYCLYFDMIMDTNYNRLQMEEQLLLKLEKQNKSRLPLQTSIWETAISQNHFYERHGFAKIRETYMPTLPLSKMDNVMIDERSIITFRELVGDQLLLEKLAGLVKYTYEQSHEANPVARMGIEEWKKLIFADDTILGGSYIYLDAHHRAILAYAFLHKGETDDTLELGWCGAIGMQYKDVIVGLVERQIAYAKNHRIPYIQGEFDTTDIYAMAVYKAFPFSPCTALITYQKK